MKNFTRLLICAFLLFTFVLNILPCGPSYITPIFDRKDAPDNPFHNFATGKIGIVKPTYHRVVLFAAYRYLNGGTFTESEQKSLVEVWDADFNNKEFDDRNAINEAIKKWIEKRREVVGKEEKTPEIYAERDWGGYEFFPNCTKNAFETATKTLSDRITSHSSEDKNVKEWIKGQDTVFQNCAGGKSLPDAPSAEMSDWLQKDRAYQIAAADFYATNYDAARIRFSDIAQDNNSPWQELSEYLVGRTLIRQASLSKDKEKAAIYYKEAEQTMQAVASRSGKYSLDAEKLLGLIKYRLHPQERVRELAQKLTFQGNENFRQDLIDYYWLLDKFEKETLETEEKRKAAANSNTDNTNSAYNPDSNTNQVNWEELNEQRENGEILTIYFSYNQGTLVGNTATSYKSYTFKPDITIDEAVSMVSNDIGRQLTNEEIERLTKSVEEAKKQREYYISPNFRLEKQIQKGYQGGYWGEEKLSLSLLPDFLRSDDLTDWLFIYQMQNAEAYLYSLSKYHQTEADIWLMTAISKAEKSSTELNFLIDSAKKLPTTSPAHPTVAYHLARVLTLQGKTAEAKKYLDEIMQSSIDMPISTWNQFLALRMDLSDTLDDFLKYAQRKPFAFDWDGESGTIDEIIAEQKSWYNPESYPDKTREQYEREIEENFQDMRVWQDRFAFDYKTVQIMNIHFPLSVLVEAQKSPALPDYLREKFALAVWTRAVILGDFVTADKITPELIKYHPEFEESLKPVSVARTPITKQNAAIYFILQNPVVSPFIEDGMGKSDNEFEMWDANDWWCAPYEEVYDENSGNSRPISSVPKPTFLTAAQSAKGLAERKKIAEMEDAPKFLANKVLEWQKRSPLDKRIPESLYIVYQANGWTKYGCGNNEDLQQQIGNLMRKRYPNSEWTKKLNSEENEQ
jgi:hypothetical protein